MAEACSVSPESLAGVKAAEAIKTKMPRHEAGALK
jgi:hypothetical protein